MTCNTCGYSYCGMNNCPLEYSDIAYIPHQHYPDPTTTCVCKTLRPVKTDNHQILKCVNQKCKVLHCPISNCSYSIDIKSSLNRHIMTSHKILIPESQRKNECSCGQIKPARIPTINRNKCPKCGMHWCLVGDCEYVCQSVLPHLKRVHNLT